MFISNYLKTKLIDTSLRGIAYTPTEVYIALYTDNPTDLDVGTEVTNTLYARRPITFDVDVNGITQNNTDIEFPISDLAWGTIKYIGIRDSLTVGNLLYYAPLTRMRVINKNTQLIFKIGQVVLTMGG